MRYLLDTNIISDLVRNPHGRVTENIRLVGEARVCTSVIVAAELRYGAARKGSRRLLTQMETLLGVLPVMPFEPPADAAYGVIRDDLEKRGLAIGGNDLLIAAHAITLGCIMVTDNVREFGRVAGLSCENWLREA